MKNGLYRLRVGKGEPLVLLHGFGWHSAIFNPLKDLLSPHFELFLIDLPGFGNSPFITDSYSLDVVLALIFDCVPTSAYWLGWSLGGMIAAHAAIQNPEKVHKLITVGSSPKFLEEADWPGVSINTFKHFSTAILTQFEKTAQEFIELQLRGSRYQSSLLPQLKNSLTQPDQRALLGGLHLLETLDLRDTYQHIQCPHLSIFGSHDALVPQAIATRIEALSKNTQSIVIQRSGHIPFISQETIFLDLLLRFLLAS